LLAPGLLTVILYPFSLRREEEETCERQRESQKEKTERVAATEISGGEL